VNHSSPTYVNSLIRVKGN